ncbi:MAG: OmpH family outer membrane protein [Saprospiraceae bacterium]|jgi:outer membrane protein|nr:OmpH family outer membrane protein [Saprospiraceae bacterium]HRD80671.1 OmpH family outer membrane protein [Saprospiraceae bacterium]HRF39006.1 OmpH family outer membrane protein [Saprospiraceae bacterium]HRJ13380.1 OmpH family outer membrane protein [Saprospiraceae bacterium]HRK83735.1 OmpH family outer membrane protein [Saprospiraceae bacterium]
MKNNIIIAAIAALLVATAFLTSNCNQNQGGTQSAAQAKETGPKIVFVNADTLLANYEYMNQKQEEFGQREAKADADLKARGRALEKEFMAAQEKIQKGLLAPNQIAVEEQRLGQKQQALAAEQERLTRELMAEGQKLQEELNKTIKSLLADIQKEKGYDYILSYGPGTGVLMVNDSLDITQMVLERLNKKEEK